MTTASERLDQIELERQKEKEISDLRQRYCCRCVIRGAKPIVGVCSFCKGTGIAPDKQKEFDRELEEIEDRFSLNPKLDLHSILNNRFTSDNRN